MVANWSDRTLPTHATQNRRFQGVHAGAAWEHAIELANLTDKDLWLCVPDLATDDYVRQLATLLRDTLEPDRKIYLEWSNETWNMTFAQACQNLNAAVAEVNAGGSTLNFDGSTSQAVWAWRRVGRRIAQVSAILRSVFGDAAMMTRVRPVLAMQSSNPVTVRLPLEYIDRFFGAPCRSLFDIAEAPYFTLSAATSEGAGPLRGARLGARSEGGPLRGRGPLPRAREERMTTSCPKCGEPLPVGGAVGGVCPRCAVDFLLESDAETRSRATAEEDLLRTGQLGPYRLLSKLGQGGMGVVYLAEQTSLRRRVALKLLPAALAEDAEFASRFQREAQAMAALSHPNIVSIYDAGIAGDRFYYAMELVEGTSLRGLLTARKLDPAAVLGMVAQLCDALAYALAKGVIHRDVKPENILVDAAGRVKLADFGLARLTMEATQRMPALTGTLEILGTPRYMAPEQMERPKEVDHRADLYSLGVVIYEMLTGEAPSDVYIPPSRKAPVDARWDAIVRKALSESPDRRYGSAAELKEETSRCTLRRPPSPRVLSTPPRSPAGRMGLPAAAIALLVIAVVLLARGWKPGAQHVASMPTPAAPTMTIPPPDEPVPAPPTTPDPGRTPDVIASAPPDPAIPHPATPTDPTPVTPDPAPVTPDPAPVVPDPTPVAPDPAPRPDDLIALDDEFKDKKSLASWTRLSVAERLPADRFDRLEVDASGSLVMVPNPNVWYGEYRGAFLYKTIEGDFAITTRVQVSGRDGKGTPDTIGSVAGILIRAPRGAGHAAGEEFVFHGLGRMEAQGTCLFGVQTLPTAKPWSERAAVDAPEAELQVARLGTRLYLLAKGTEGRWRVQWKLRDAALPKTLQVGLAACTDWATVQRLTPKAYESRIVIDGHPDLLARVDWVHFRRPRVPAGTALPLDAPGAIPDADLLGFLGGAASGE